MIKTCGLTHIHLVVKDVRRSLAFYKSVFGMEESFWAGDGMVFLNTPGSNDLIALHESEDDETIGSNGGILHFGFSCRTSPTSIAPSARSSPLVAR